MTFLDRVIPAGLGRKVGAMALSRSISMVSALLVAIILTRLLPEATYGIYRKLWLVFMLLVPSLTGATVGTLYYRGSVPGNRNPALIIAACLLAFSGLAVGLINYFGITRLAHIIHIAGSLPAFRYFSIYIFFAVFAGLAEPLFVHIGHKRWLIGYAVIYNTLETCLIVIPFALGCKLQTIVLIMCVGPMLRSFFIAWLLIRSIPDWPGFSMLRKEWNRSLPFATGLFLVAIAGIASGEVDKWAISIHFNSDFIFAIYSIGARKIPFLSAITASITSSLVVHYTGDMSGNRFSSVIPAMRNATDRLFLFITPSLVFCFAFAPQIMVLFFHKYAASAPIFRVYLITTLFQFFFAESIIQGTGNSRLNAIAGFAELGVNLVLSIYLVNTIGILGPPIATLISHGVFLVVLIGYCRTRFGMRIRDFMPTRRIRPLVVTLPLLAGSVIFLKSIPLNEWIGMIAGGIILGILMMIQIRMNSLKPVLS